MGETDLRLITDAYESICVLIPAYNTEGTVGSVIEGVRQVSNHLTILVVDDGSTDRTGQIAKNAGAMVMTHEHNMGKGAALRTGFEEFLKRNLAAVITLDADGQHSPGEIPKLIERWLLTRADIVIGTRKRHLGGMPILRILTNTVSSWLVSLSSGRNIPDSQSGYRLFTREVVHGIETRSSGYAAESEILIKAGAQGLKIDSAPISTIYRDEKSHIHPLKQPFLFLGLIMSSLFWRFGRIGTKGSR